MAVNFEKIVEFAEAYLKEKRIPKKETYLCKLTVGEETIDFQFTVSGLSLKERHEAVRAAADDLAAVGTWFIMASEEIKNLANALVKKQVLKRQSDIAELFNEADKRALIETIRKLAGDEEKAKLTVKDTIKN